MAGIVGIIRFRRLPQNLRYLAALGWFIFPIELLGQILGSMHRNTLFLMPIYTVGEFSFLALIYRQTLQSASFTRIIPWLLVGFSSYALLDSLLFSSSTLFRPGQEVVESVLVLGFVGLYFRKLLYELQVKSLKQEPMFWVSVGLFLYFLGYLQIALFSNYMLRYSIQLSASIWAINSILHILLHSCYCLALWMRPAK